MIKNLLLCYVVFNVCTALPMEQGKRCTPDVMNYLMVRFFNFQNDPRFIQYCQKNPTAGHEIPISLQYKKERLQAGIKIKEESYGALDAKMVCRNFVTIKWMPMMHGMIKQGHIDANLVRLLFLLCKPMNLMEFQHLRE